MFGLSIQASLDFSINPFKPSFWPVAKTVGSIVTPSPLNSEYLETKATYGTENFNKEIMLGDTT